MKILLIYPYFLEARVHVEEIAAVPMGLYYIGALLKSRYHDVEILNWYDAKDAPDAIEKALKSRNPDLIAFSIVHANRWGGIEIARIAKKLFPTVPVVFGGIGATFLWRHLLTHFQEIDYIVRGEGEYTFASLVSAIEKRAPAEDIADIPGLALRNGRRITATADAPLIEDLDALPPPARFFDFQHVSMTRGCPGRCRFCGSPQFWRRRVRAHSTGYMVDQLAALSRRGIHHFYLSDDTFTLNADRVIDLCRKLIDSGLTFCWQAISKVSAVNDEMLYWMRKAGCIQISYGVESGSPQIRDHLCKDIRQDQIKAAFRRTVAHGILARAYFIYGCPGETRHTIEQTLALMRRIKPLSTIFYILDLFPGTALYEDYKAGAGVDDDIWLQRIEDILYYETDAALDEAAVSAYGRRLRETFHQWVADFALQIELKDDASLYAEQADFLSRLGMTFSHGDYARLKGPAHPLKVAEQLYQRALSLHPDHRAYWGLALILQKQGEWERAIEMLQRGLKHHPRSPQLNISLGIAWANKGLYAQALKHLQPFDNQPDAAAHIIRCLRAMGKNREADLLARR